MIQNEFCRKLQRRDWDENVQKHKFSHKWIKFFKIKSWMPATERNPIIMLLRKAYE